MQQTTEEFAKMLTHVVVRDGGLILNKEIYGHMEAAFNDVYMRELMLLHDVSPGLTLLPCLCQQTSLTDRPWKTYKHAVYHGLGSVYLDTTTSLTCVQSSSRAPKTDKNHPAPSSPVFQHRAHVGPNNESVHDYFHSPMAEVPFETGLAYGGALSHAGCEGYGSSVPDSLVGVRSCGTCRLRLPC